MRDVLAPAGRERASSLRLLEDPAGVRLRRDAGADRDRPGPGGACGPPPGACSKAWPAYPCVVISGRSRDDVGRRLRGVPLAGVVGNHGLEPWHAESRATRGVGRWHSAPGGRAGGHPGSRDRGQGPLDRRSLPAVSRQGEGAGPRPRRRHPTGPGEAPGRQAGPQHPARRGATQGHGPRAREDPAAVRDRRVRGRRRDRRGRVRTRPAGAAARNPGRPEEGLLGGLLRPDPGGRRPPAPGGCWPSGRGPASRPGPCRRSARRSSSCGFSGRSTTACRGARSGWRPRWA